MGVHVILREDSGQGRIGGNLVDWALGKGSSSPGRYRPRTALRDRLDDASSFVPSPGVEPGFEDDKTTRLCEDSVAIETLWETEYRCGRKWFLPLDRIVSVRPSLIRSLHHLLCPELEIATDVLAGKGRATVLSRVLRGSAQVSRC